MEVLPFFVFSTLRLHSERSSTPDHTHHRLSWCPYVAQEEGEDEEEGWLLAVSHGCEVRWKKRGREGGREDDGVFVVIRVQKVMEILPKSCLIFSAKW